MTGSRFINIKKNALIISLAVLFLIFLSTVLLMCTTPPVDRDALTHHLAVPRLYLKHGSIYEIPEIEFSYYPQLVDLIYAVPLFFRNDIIPKYIHFAFALFTAFFIYRMLKQRTRLPVALSGAFFFLAIPVITRLSASVYVDLGLFFFSYVSMYYLLEWYKYNKEGATPSGRPKWKFIFFSALSCGLAMSCKYNGLIVFFLMSLSVLWLASKKYHSLKALSASVLFCLISTGVFSPWMIKNFIWTGNPLYPLYNGFFNHSEIKKASPSPDHDHDFSGVLKTTTVKSQINDSLNNNPEKTESVKRSHFYYRRVIFGETLIETLSTPARIFFQGRDDDPKYFDGVLNPLLFFMPLLTLFIEFKRLKLNRKDKSVIPDYEKILLFAFSWAFIIFVYVQTDMRTRWVGPAIAPLVVLSFIGIDELWSYAENLKDNKSAVIRFLVIASVAAMFAMNAFYIKDLFGRIDPLPFIKGKTSRDEYIQKHRSEYAAYQYINRNLPDSARIFGLFVGNRRYYCDRSMITDENIFRNIAMNAENTENIMDKLASMSITHFVVGEGRYASWSKGVLNEDTLRIISDFWKTRTRRIFSEYGYSVYEIVK